MDLETKCYMCMGPMTHVHGCWSCLAELCPMRGQTQATADDGCSTWFDRQVASLQLVTVQPSPHAVRDDDAFWLFYE